MTRESIADFREGRASQTTYQRLLDAVPDAMAVVDPHGFIVLVNAQTEKTFGYARAELFGTKFETLVPERFRAHLPTNGPGFFTEPAACSQTLYGLCKDGREFPIEITVSVLEMVDGHLASIVVRDIRERARAEQRFRNLLEATPDATVLVAPGGTIELVNAQMEKLFGYSRDELVGEAVERLFASHCRAEHLQLQASHLASPHVAASWGLELHGVRKDGTEFPIEVSLSALETEKGVLLSSVIRDISERKKSDEQRFLLAAIVESTDDAIISKRLDGTITSWNEAAHRILGYTAEEIVGKPISLLIPPGREEEERDVIKQLKRGCVEHFETLRLHKDGREIPVAVTTSPMMDPNGKVVGGSKIVRDMTDRRHKEEALAHAKELADVSSRELEAFSYSIAHDLRAPLRGMGGSAEVLLGAYGPKLDQAGKDWLGGIVENARKMGALIDALLYLARLTRTAPRRETVDLSAMVRAAADRLAVAEPGRAVEWVVQADVVADLDPELARALVENLIGNAWKFTSKVPHARIEFGTTGEKPSRVYFVRDNGAGFDMAVAGKLFGAFQRLHSPADFPGTGIGLATVQRIILRHGGRVWAEGVVNGGATVRFTLHDRAASRQGRS